MIRPWEQTLQSVLLGLPPSSRCEHLSQHGWRHLHSFFLVLVPLLASSHSVGYGVALTMITYPGLKVFVMIRSIFTSLSSLSRLIFFISYLHMPFPYFGSYLSYLSYLHVLSAIPILISYLLSCT